MRQTIIAASILAAEALAGTLLVTIGVAVGVMWGARTAIGWAHG